MPFFQTGNNITFTQFRFGYPTASTGWLLPNAVWSGINNNVPPAVMAFSPGLAFSLESNTLLNAWDDTLGKYVATKVNFEWANFEIAIGSGGFRSTSTTTADPFGPGTSLKTDISSGHQLGANTHVNMSLSVFQF
jgi:hypothetical protein